MKLKRVSHLFYGIIAVALIAGFAWLLSPGNRNQALIQAIEAKDGTQARELLAHGADANRLVYKPVHPLLHRIFGSLLGTSRWNFGGDTVLEFAIEQAMDTPTIRALVDNGANVNVTDGYHTTPLVKAACRSDVVKLLLEHGAEPDIYSGHSISLTALGAATDCGDVESIKLLLKHGADPNIKDKYRSPLIAAKGHPEIIRLLKNAGAK